MYNRDWRKASDYDYTETLTNVLWAWEFLRRNEEYIAEWNKTLKKYRIERKKYGAKSYKQLSDLLDHGKGSFNPFPIPGFGKDCKSEDLDAKTRRLFTWLRESYKNQDLEQNEPDRISSQGARKRWGLIVNEIVNPALDNPYRDTDDPVFHLYGYYFDKDNINILADMEDSEVAAVFDLTLPIPQQLTHFKLLLSETQKEYLDYRGLEIKETRRNKDAKRGHALWTIYLRILDGRAAMEKDGRSAREKNREIASIMFPGDDNFKLEDKVEDHLEQAKILVQKEGYMAILRKPAKMRNKK